MTKRSEFLAGDRPDDVLFFLHEDAVDDVGALEEYAESVADGLILVLPGENGRSAFQKATGIDPMALARQAMETEGAIEADLTGGRCPEEQDEPEENHTARFVFSFVQEETEEAGGIYAEGAVVHAYAVCHCGERYSQKWVAGER